MKTVSKKLVEECLQLIKRPADLGGDDFKSIADNLKAILDAESIPDDQLPKPLPSSVKAIAIEIKRFMLTYASRFQANKLYTFYELTPEELQVYYGNNGFLAGCTYLSMEYKGVILDIHRHSVGIDADNLDDLQNAAAILTEALVMFKKQIPL